MLHVDRYTMILTTLYVVLSLLDVLSFAQENVLSGANRLDCVKASEQCLKEPGCSSKYRTMRQCIAGKESNFSMVSGLEAKDECRSAMDALKQSPLYNCRCKRGMKKEKNCLRIYWGIYQTLQGNDFLEDSPYETVNSRLSDIFRLAPIISEGGVGAEPWSSPASSAPGRGPQGGGAQGRAPLDRDRGVDLQDPMTGPDGFVQCGRALYSAPVCQPVEWLYLNHRWR
ncbi:GDNF family receptor alpha-1-like [Osmerus mordax]|uniref:GDNF family receptor alpha-1-like n=1 Tax=Osmerus mordax TaxID=8014 RepID=UPI00350F48D3